MAIGIEDIIGDVQFPLIPYFFKKSDDNSFVIFHNGDAYTNIIRSCFAAAAVFLMHPA